MKMRILAMFLVCVLLAGCGASVNGPEETTAEAPVETAAEETVQPEEAASVIAPLPDTTLQTLEDAILNVSLNENCFSQDASGKLFLQVQIYSYDKFDMVDISGLKAGDRLLLSGEEITVESVARNDHGTVLVNGGLDEGGFDLATDDDGFYYVHGYSDSKSWNIVCETRYLVSDGFVFTDSADLEVGEVTCTAQELMEKIPGTEFGYQPQNTTVRIENSQLVSMERVYTP